MSDLSDYFGFCQIMSDLLDYFGFCRICRIMTDFFGPKIFDGFCEFCRTFRIMSDNGGFLGSGSSQSRILRRHRHHNYNL